MKMPKPSTVKKVVRLGILVVAKVAVDHVMDTEILDSFTEVWKVFDQTDAAKEAAKTATKEGAKKAAKAAAKAASKAAK
jgi:hypothetical protein